MNLVSTRLAESRKSKHGQNTQKQNRTEQNEKWRNYYAIINPSNKCNEFELKSKNEMAIYAMRTFKRGDHVTSHIDAILVLIKWLLHRKPSFQRYNFI